MADDGDGNKADGPAKGTGPRRSTEANEWTLSDHRGPLEAAGSDRQDAETTIGPHRPDPPSHDGHENDEAARIEPDAPAAETPSAPSAAVPEITEPPARRPVLAVLAALVVGAIIGAASAAIVYKSSDQGAGSGNVAALTARVDGLEKRPDLQPQLDALKTSVDRIGSAQTTPAFDPGPLQQKIQSLQGEVDGLKKQDPGQALGDKVAALDAAVTGLKDRGVDVKGLDSKVAALATAIDGLKKEDAAAQAGIASLQTGQKALEGKAGAPALAVVADSLVEAISHGRPYARQVEALGGLGADPTQVAVLRENADKGVPSARDLAVRFAPLADPIMATANRAPANAGFVDRLKSGMLGMVSVRRADTTEGDDAGSRVSRIEADLAHDDVAGAYATWSGLPAEAKAKADAWAALAKTHVAAMGAARALQQQGIAALGARKT